MPCLSAQTETCKRRNKTQNQDFCLETQASGSVMRLNVGGKDKWRKDQSVHLGWNTIERLLSLRRIKEKDAQNEWNKAWYFTKALKGFLHWFSCFKFLTLILDVKLWYVTIQVKTCFVFINCVLFPNMFKMLIWPLLLLDPSDLCLSNVTTLKNVSN